MAPAKEGWRKYLAGEVSVSVLETGRSDSARKNAIVAEGPRDDMRELVRIDVGTVAMTVIRTAYRPAIRSLYKPILSTNGRFIAALVHGAPAGSAQDDPV